MTDTPTAPSELAMRIERSWYGRSESASSAYLLAKHISASGLAELEAEYSRTLANLEVSRVLLLEEQSRAATLKAKLEKSGNETRIEGEIIEARQAEIHRLESRLAAAESINGPSWAWYNEVFRPALDRFDPEGIRCYDPVSRLGRLVHERDEARGRLEVIAVRLNGLIGTQVEVGPARELRSIHRLATDEGGSDG